MPELLLEVKKITGKIKEVKVINEKVNINNDPEEFSLKLIDLGSYFPRIRSQNFYIEESDFIEFYKEFPDKGTSWHNLRKLHNQIQEENKNSEVKKEFPYKLYAKTSEHPVTKKCYVMPFLLFRTNPCKDTFVFHKEINDMYCKHVIKEYREHNMPILRTFYEGDAEADLKCKIRNTPVENFTITWEDETTVSGNCFDLHHMLVKNGESLRKLKQDPIALVNSLNLDDPKNIDKLYDIMGTTIVSKDAHLVIHKNKNQGIEKYREEQLPWALRSEENFLEFHNKYNVEVKMTYDNFIHFHSSNSVIEINNNQIESLDND